MSNNVAPQLLVRLSKTLQAELRPFQTHPSKSSEGDILQTAACGGKKKEEERDKKVNKATRHILLWNIKGS